MASFQTVVSILDLTYTMNNHLLCVMVTTCSNNLCCSRSKLRANQPQYAVMPLKIEQKTDTPTSRLVSTSHTPNSKNVALQQ